MKSRHLLLAVALVCIALLAAAMYMQLGLNMQPCPLCVLQRYAFVAIAIFCLIGGLGGFTKPNAGLALIGALSGVGVAGYHLYVKAHPDFFPAASIRWKPRSIRSRPRGCFPACSRPTVFLQHRLWPDPGTVDSDVGHGLVRDLLRGAGGRAAQARLSAAAAMMVTVTVMR
ncbi:disulfide bond formation protein B [Undibacterium arcticum]